MAFLTDSKASFGIYSLIEFMLKTCDPKYSEDLSYGFEKFIGLCDVDSSILLKRSVAIFYIFFKYTPP